MQKFIVSAIFCSLFLVIQAASVQQKDASTIVVSDLSEYLREHPEFKVVAKLERSILSKSSIKYTLGKRIQGDRLVANSFGETGWKATQDARFKLTYPPTGTNTDSISYVEIIVNQSTNSGDGFVLDGGIGYTHIIIAIDARATTFFDQNTKIFGY